MTSKSASKLLRELDMLRKRQRKALSNARFIPMTTVELDEYNAGRLRIAAILKSLAGLAGQDRRAS